MSAEHCTEPPAANMGGWLLGLQANHHQLAGRWRENPDPYKIARQLRLPVPAYAVFATPGAFLADTQAGLQPLWEKGIRNYYVGLRPLADGLSKFRNEAPMPAEQVAPYIAAAVPPEQNHLYALRVAEYVVAVCGMVIVCNPSGAVHADMVLGDLGPLATGRQRPDYQARSDRFTGVLRFRAVSPEASAAQTGFEQDRAQQLPVDHPVFTPQIRAAASRAINAIPPYPGEMRGGREPGRYEAAIVDHAGALTPVFVDAQPDYLVEAKAGPGRHPFALPETALY